MGVAIITRPTPINRDASLVAYEFMGKSPNVAGVQPSAAAADHGHALGTSIRQVTGFGLAQSLNNSGFLGNGWVFMTNDVGALPPMPIWTFEFLVNGLSAVQYGIGFWKQGTSVGTPNPVAGPVGDFTDVPAQIGITAVGAAQPGFVFGDGSSLAFGTAAGWNAIAISYDGARFYCFVNGVLVGTHASTAGAIPADWLAGFGATADNNNSGSFTIDEIRVSNTVRYTADYTVASVPFVTDSATVALWHLDDTPLGYWINYWNGGGYVHPPPGAIVVPSGWAWLPGASADSSGNNVMLGVATYNSGNSSYESIKAGVAGISPDDGISKAQDVSSINAQTGDLVLTDSAGNPIGTAVPQSDGTTQIQLALSGGGPGDPWSWLVSPVN